MVDREDAEIGLVVHQPAAVVGWTGKADAAAVSAGRNDGLDLPERSRFGIEGHPHQVIPDAVHLPGNVVGFRLAVIEGFPIRGEGRGRFQPVFRGQTRVHDEGMVPHIHHYQVGGGVKYLDGLLVSRPEALADRVDGTRDPLPTGMPVAIGHVAQGAVGLGRHPFAVTVLLEERRAMLAAQMEQELGRIRGIGGMAVHALAGRERALDDGFFLEAVDVALVQADAAVGGIARGDLAVGDAVIGQRRVADVHDKVTPLGPLTVLASQNRELKRAAGILLREFPPGTERETGPFALHLQGTAFASRHLDQDAVIIRREIEIHRRDPGGNRDADVIGIDVRKQVHIGRAPLTGRDRHQGRQQRNPSFHRRPSICLRRCQTL